MGRVLSAILLTAVVAAAQRETVIVDTDSGLFGDDGAALVMLLRSPEITIPGITIVPGNGWAPQGAEYMLHILDLLHRPEMPVYTGAEVPLTNSVAMAREEERRWGKLEY